MMRWIPVVLLCICVALTSVLAAYDVDKACQLIRNPCWSKYSKEKLGEVKFSVAIEAAADDCRNVVMLEKALDVLEKFVGCRYSKAMIQWLTLADLLLIYVTPELTDRLSAKNRQIWQQQVGPLLKKAGTEAFKWARTFRVLDDTLPSSDELEYLLQASAAFSVYANDKAQELGDRKWFSRLQLIHTTVLQQLFEYTVSKCIPEEVEWDSEGVFDNSVTANYIKLKMNDIMNQLKAFAEELNLVDSEEVTAAVPVGFVTVEKPDSFMPDNGQVMCKWQGVMLNVTKVYENLLDDCRPHLFASYALFTDYVLTVTLYTYIAKYLQVYIQSKGQLNFGVEPDGDPEHLRPIRSVIFDTSTHPRYSQNGSLRLLRERFDSQRGGKPENTLTVIDLKLILDGYIEQVGHFVRFHWEDYEPDTIELVNDVNPHEIEHEQSATKHVVYEEKKHAQNEHPQTESPKEIFDRILTCITQYLDEKLTK